MKTADDTSAETTQTQTSEPVAPPPDTAIAAPASDLDFNSLSVEQLGVIWSAFHGQKNAKPFPTAAKARAEVQKVLKGESLTVDQLVGEILPAFVAGDNKTVDGLRETIDRYMDAHNMDRTSTSDKPKPAAKPNGKAAPKKAAGGKKPAGKKAAAKKSTKPAKKAAARSSKTKRAIPDVLSEVKAGKIASAKSRNGGKQKAERKPRRQGVAPISAGRFPAQTVSPAWKKVFAAIGKAGDSGISVADMTTQCEKQGVGAYYRRFADGGFLKKVGRGKYALTAKGRAEIAG